MTREEFNTLLSVIQKHVVDLNEVISYLAQQNKNIFTKLDGLESYTPKKLKLERARKKLDKIEMGPSVKGRKGCLDDVVDPMVRNGTAGKKSKGKKLKNLDCGESKPVPTLVKVLEFETNKLECDRNNFTFYLKPHTRSSPFVVPKVRPCFMDSLKFGLNRPFFYRVPAWKKLCLLKFIFKKCYIRNFIDLAMDLFRLEIEARDLVGNRKLI